jgi:Holliday junction resolvase RusA-like endonuclease
MQLYADLAKDQIDQQPLVQDKNEALFLDILFLCNGPKRGDYSNQLKMLEDALNRIAWTDDKQIFGVNGLIVPHQEKECTLLRINSKTNSYAPR